MRREEQDKGEWQGGEVGGREWDRMRGFEDKYLEYCRGAYMQYSKY